MIADTTMVDVCNADLRYMEPVQWHRAVRWLVEKKAHPLSGRSPTVLIRSASLVLELPAVVVHSRYVDRPFKRPQPSRVNVLRRDRHTCMYCGDRGDTIDHIMPRCRGGKDTWDNMVAACGPCNNVKDDRTPEEAGMRLLREPFEPKGNEKFWFPESV